MSSSESEPKIPLHKAKKKSKPQNSRSKPKAKVPVIPADEDERSNPDWDYKPPPGAVLMDHRVDTGEFDWDAVNADENLELWVIRVPDDLKAKYLQDVKLDVPSSSETARIGSIDRKHTSYDVWSLGDSPADAIGGEEIKGLSCLLPRQKKGGKLYQAPKPIARHLVIAAKPALPTPEASEVSASDASSLVYKNPPRYRYPAEVLTHHFMPLGSLARTGDSPEAMDVDQVEELLGDTQGEEVSPAKHVNALNTVAAANGLPKKKRKGDREHAKKSKNTKTVVG